MKPISLVLTVVTVTGCGRSSSLPRARFANTAAIERVDDRRNVATPPRERTALHMLYNFDSSFHRPVTRALEVPRSQRALGINALDEVPDSSWFTNRIGKHDLTPDEVGTGSLTIDSPEAHTPWTILSTKKGGTTLGMIVRDARGERFLIKFDRAGRPEMETAADAIVDRLLWACGYHVTEDFVAFVRRSDLEIASNATTKDEVGDTRRFVVADLDELLSQIEIEGDGRIRVLASRMLAGKPLGGHPAEGVRRDDPNDRVPHERRRDLRGARPIFAWLDHIDITTDNTLDMWVEDPTRPGHHYVDHFWLDFGFSLGVMAASNRDPRQSYAYVFDYPAMFESFVTLGIARQDWESRGRPNLRGVGLYDVASYDPGGWHPNTQAGIPLTLADRVDWFWGAKILMRFTREQLRAAVAAGRLSDPRSADYLVATLVGRQRATARHAFLRVSPLDRFAVTEAGAGASVCFDDLLLTYALGGHGPTSYRVNTYDRQGRSLATEQRFRPTANGHSCTAPVRTARDPAGYTIVKIDTRRGSVSHAVFVHLAREPRSRIMRVIGIWRE